MNLEIYRGAVEDVLPSLPSNTFDGCLSDPPYGVEIAGWDADVPPPLVWAEIGRVLKPGASILSFGNARTGHRLATAIEHAGFEILESLAWLHGHGMPKSTNTALRIDKAHGCPSRGRAFNVAGMNASGGTSQSPHYVEAYEPRTPAAQPWKGYTASLKPVYEPIIRGRWPMEGTCAQNALKWGCGSLNTEACRLDSGRFPTNVVLDEEAAAQLDVTSTLRKRKGTTYRPNRYYDDAEGPSRYFKFCPKVTKAERKAGLDGLANTHPTPKPLDLTEWLAKIILPPQHGRPRRLLVPYCGVFSEIIGALKAGWDEVVGIEIDPQFIAVGKQRLLHHYQQQ
jgi:site-specific DNA-methyltransferase (adenine-specific)